MLEEKAQNLIGDVSSLLPLIVGNTLNAAAAILILLAGLWLSGRADRLVVRMLQRTPHVDPMLQSFFGSISRYLVLTVTVLAVLSEFGIQTTSLVAILGAASLAVGLALQGTLSNLAAGVMLLIFRPFRIGHKVQIGAGSVGTVKELTPFWTELITDDKVQVIVPTSSVWSSRTPRKRHQFLTPFGLGRKRAGTTRLNRAPTRFRGSNGAFLRAGLIDEISLAICPAVDGSQGRAEHL